MRRCWRLRPMRGLKTNRTVSVVIRGHAFVQNLRRGHYELGTYASPVGRLAAAFDELALASDGSDRLFRIPHARQSANATVPDGPLYEVTEADQRMVFTVGRTGPGQGQFPLRT